MRRREFVILASGYAAVWSLPAAAQQVALPRIGLLLVGLSPESKAAQHFRRGLRDAGYIEGRNIIIEWRYAQGDYGRVSAFIDEFVRGNIDVMVMDSTVGTEAAKRATSTIPIVMALVLDPVGSGLIKSLAHPCGNVTGLSMMTTVDLNSKRLELLKGMIPQLSNVAVVWNPDHPVHGRAVEGLKTRAPSWRSSLLLWPCARRTNLSQRYRISKEERSKRCMLSRTRCFFAQRETLLKFAAAARLPTLHDVRR